MMAHFRGGALHGETIKLPDGTRSFRAYKKPSSEIGYSIWLTSYIDEYKLTYDSPVKIGNEDVYLFDNGLTDIFLVEL